MRRQILIDLFLFAATVYVAWWNGWQVADLAWSLWISSLTLGYLYILVSLVGTLVHGPIGIFKSKPSEKEEKPVKNPIARVFGPVIFVFFLTGFSKFTLYLLPYTLLIVFCNLMPILRQKPGWGFLPNISPSVGDVLIALPILLFLLVFFTVHFGGFHLVHGMFLNQFFPLIRGGTLSPSMVGELIRTALSKYWFFVLTSGLSSWKNFGKAFQVNDGSMMMRPYLNVIRMHVMIFVFAIMHALKFQGAVLYIMLALYYFPVVSLVGIFRKKMNRQERKDENK